MTLQANSGFGDLEESDIQFEDVVDSNLDLNTILASAKYLSMYNDLNKKFAKVDEKEFDENELTSNTASTDDEEDNESMKLDTSNKSACKKKIILK